MLNRLNVASLWICPFRPFFMLTAAHAIIAISLWLAALGGILPMPELPGGPVVAHAHEMIFGFAMASVAGFLLTAVVEFTGCPPIGRPALQRLVALWLAGRLAWGLAGWFGIHPAAVLDLAFIALLIGHAAGPLWRAPQRRHLAFLHTLLALAACQAGFYLSLLRGTDAMAWLRIGSGLLMILIVVALSRISMRLVNDVLEAQGGIAAPYLARPPRRGLAIFAIAAHTAAEFLLPGSTATGWLALAAAAAAFNLLNDWHVGRALFQRWVFVPYLVYWAMALGYAILGAGLLSGHNWSSAGQHLLLVGALGLAIFIVMAVAGRMHSGWGLDPRRWVPAGALLIGGAATARSAASLPAGAEASATLLEIAGGLWIAGWSLYLAWSWKALATPRPDSAKGCDEAAAAG